MKPTSTCLLLAAAFACTTAQAQTAPNQAPPRLRVAWKHAMPAAADAGVSAHGNLAVMADKKGNVSALNLADGKELWTAKLPSGGGAPPAFTPELILIGDDAGQLHALSRETGEVRFAARSGGKIVGQPLIAADRVICGSYDTNVYAISLSDGREAWKFATDAQVHAPLVQLGDLFITAGCDTQVRALDGTGQQKWSVEVSSAVAAPPLVHEQHVFVATMDATLYRIDAEGTLTWKQSLPDTGAINGAPVILNGRLLVLSDDGKLTTLDATTGEILAHSNHPGGPSALAAMGAHALLGTDEGRILFIDAAGRTVSRITLGGAVQRLQVIGEQVIASTDQGVVWLLR